MPRQTPELIALLRQDLGADRVSAAESGRTASCVQNALIKPQRGAREGRCFLGRRASRRGFSQDLSEAFQRAAVPSAGSSHRVPALSTFLQRRNKNAKVLPKKNPTKSTVFKTWGPRAESPSEQLRLPGRFEGQEGA